MKKKLFDFSKKYSKWTSENPDKSDNKMSKKGEMLFRKHEKIIKVKIMPCLWKFGELTSLTNRFD